MPWVFLAVSALVQLGASGCGSDLGECDRMALSASTGASPTQPYRGQILIHQSCASGQCHSEAAKGEARIGAPADLNFDVVPADTSPLEIGKVTRGESKVDELAEEMWTWISDGSMPPEGKRPPLEGADKEAVRNWLACGAPVNKEAITVDGRDWAQIFPSLSGCMMCHGMGSPTGAWHGGDACTTRANLLANVAVGPECGPIGSRLVVPMNPDASLLLQKLELADPCGSPMPLDRTSGVASAIAAPLRAWIAAGALAPGCP